MPNDWKEIEALLSQVGANRLQDRLVGRTRVRPSSFFLRRVIGEDDPEIEVILPEGIDVDLGLDVDDAGPLRQAEPIEGEELVDRDDIVLEDAPDPGTPLRDFSGKCLRVLAIGPQVEDFFGIVPTGRDSRGWQLDTCSPTPPRI